MSLNKVIRVIRATAMLYKKKRKRKRSREREREQVLKKPNKPKIAVDKIVRQTHTIKRTISKGKSEMKEE